MAQCEVVCPAKSTYNAVNIKINNPKASISDKKKFENGNGEYNAVNLEINNPELRNKPVYSYPDYDSIVTADMAMIPFDIPEIPLYPISYKTSYVNNRTYIAADLDSDSQKPETVMSVPEPYLTTTENEKNPVFHGISFRAANKPEIVADAKIKPAIDINVVTDNLASDNLDVQAKQMEEIVSASLTDEKSALPYISTIVFSHLIDIAERDTSSMEGPSEEQTEIRKKIISNEIARAKQAAEGKKADDIELPYAITSDEFAKALVLSPLELAERNKEYGLLTLAALSRVYVDDFKKQTGNVVPLTDVPGASTMVEALRNSKNPSVKIAAIEALVYINRSEYTKEITAVLEVAAEDSNKAVSSVALSALKCV